MHRRGIASCRAGSPEWHTSPLNPRYSFDQFVIGGSNHIGHAAALAVAEQPAQAFNPLFVYGAPGVGKTHLLHAIGNYLRRAGAGDPGPLPDRRELRRDLPQRAARQHDPGLQGRPAPQRRAADRRRAVPAEQGQDRGRVLPHLQPPARGRPPARDQLRPHAARSSTNSPTGCASALSLALS